MDTWEIDCPGCHGYLAFGGNGFASEISRSKAPTRLTNEDIGNEPTTPGEPRESIQSSGASSHFLAPPVHVAIFIEPSDSVARQLHREMQPYVPKSC